MKWVTRENAKVDRIACPWLIRRFIDPDARFLYVPADEVMAVAEREGAIPYDVPEDIDTASEGQGLKAIAHGFSLLFGKEDAKKIELETPMYDALYAWCRKRVELSGAVG